MKNIFPDYIVLKKIRYYENTKKIEIIVTSENFIKQEILCEVLENIKKELQRENISIIDVYEVDKNDSEKLMEYEKKIRTKLNTEFPVTKELNGNLKIEYIKEDSTYEITIIKSVIFDILKKKNAKEILEKHIKEQIGLNLFVRLNLKEQDSDFERYIKQQEEEMARLATKTFSMNAEEKNETEKPKKRQTEVKGDAVSITEIKGEMQEVIIVGEIYNPEIIELRNNKKLLSFIISDNTDSIYAKRFINDDEDILKKGQYVKASGKVEFDQFKKEYTFMLKKVQDVPRIIKKDLAGEKMVELHCHTLMSQMDSLIRVEELAKRLSQYEHRAVAIVDHCVVQAYPKVMDEIPKNKIKPIYGCEFNMIEDSQEHIKVRDIAGYDDEYVVFDLETTGFSNKNDKITEIGAVKIKNCCIVDTFSRLVNPEVPIPEKIQKLTGITDQLVADKPVIQEVLPEFLKFCKGSILVAHNSDFDTGFIREKSRQQNLEYDFDAIDTLVLSRLLLEDSKNHKLNTIAKRLGVSLENHHRAVDDATATANIFLKFIEILKKREIKNFNEINDKIKNIDLSKIRTSGVVVLAKNQKGLKDLYKLVTLAHTKYLYSAKPEIPKSVLKKYRKDLLLASGFAGSDIFESVMRNKPKDVIENLIDFYDYIEINPASAASGLITDESVKDIQEIENINKTIYNMAKEKGKTVIAASNAHYLDENEKLYRKILKASLKRRDENPDDDLYFRTTDQMLEEFSYLGEEVANEIVVKNTNKVADIIEEVIPVPSGTFPPEIEGSEEQLKTMCYEKAKRIYGDPIPEIVEKRLEKELNSIIGNGYAVMYIIAQKLVTKSLSDGYLVGSRGSVGSSLAAYMSDITEVNALAPHYICPNCKNSEFILDNSYPTGADMPDKNCPKCGTKYRKDGFDIPFETFLGFNGDKEPDIDLNFAGEYQPNAHAYTMELFGKDYVYRAGTIGTVAEKTAYGYIKKYEEESNEKFSNANIEVIQKHCIDVKRTSGQHPGGVMVVPKYKDIYDFSPVQYPANDKKSGTLTTHFDYHSISGRILKLDILGHDGPSIIKQLESLTNTVATEVPLDDKRTVSLFSSTKELGCDLDEIDCVTGTLGIPEFGTKFVRQMLVDTKPTTLGELVRISGLSHGTDVWVNNAQDLVRNNVVPLKETICTRDDIMLYLLAKDLEPLSSFKIMEDVRKGKGLKEDYEKQMRQHKVPDWYIDSCKKIKYMFPKAHAAAYVMLSFRIAYYKIYYKEAFYATYFTTKVDDYDISTIEKGKDAIVEKIKEINMLGNTASVKEKNQLTVLEVALEMCKRGVKVEKVDLYKSDAKKFILSEDNAIIPPFFAISGLGEVVAEKIVEEARKKPFISIEDLKNRTGASKTVIQELQDSGCLDELSDTNQICFKF